MKFYEKNFAPFVVHIKCSISNRNVSCSKDGPAGPAGATGPAGPQGPGGPQGARMVNLEPPT